MAGPRIDGAGSPPAIDSFRQRFLRVKPLSSFLRGHDQSIR
jgi:hypothetical protein